MNKEIQKMLAEAKKELLEKQEQQEMEFEANYGVIEQQIWRDFIEARAEENISAGYIYSHWYKFNSNGNICDLESDLWIISGISEDKLRTRLADDMIDLINSDNGLMAFRISQVVFEEAMDKAYIDSKKKKKKSKKKKLSRDYYSINTKTKDKEKEKEN